MKIPTNPPEVKDTTAERRAAFLLEVERRSSPLDPIAVWEILDTVRKRAPKAWEAFIRVRSITARGKQLEIYRREKYATLIKPQRDAECYAQFLYRVHCWQTIKDGKGTGPLLDKAQAIKMHGKYKALGFPVEAWRVAQTPRRKRMGLRPMQLTELLRLQKKYDADTEAGKSFRDLVRGILTGKVQALTPFMYEELSEFVRDVDDDNPQGMPADLAMLL